jgi:tetratricopeptide (TPR) repeat protein
MTRPAVCALFLLATAVFAQPPYLRDAVSWLQRGDFPAAERELRRQVSAHPDDALALSLLGVALDNQKRISEAGAFHDRAVAAAPRSTDVLNNYAAHLWIAGDYAASRKAYERVLAIDPAHAAANLQLARVALQDRDGRAALRYLDRLPADDPQVLQMRLDALSLAGEYEKAQALCEAALRSDPSSFALLYNLGVIATYAGHSGRAVEALEAALRREPGSVDALIALGRAHAAARQWMPAVQSLAQAAKVEPGRAEVHKLIALTATELGALDDAEAAWRRYVALAPSDDAARRELSYLAAQRGDLETGIRGLQQYVAKHPREAVGYYQLGQAQRALDSAKAFEAFDKALEVDPKYTPARAARGSLYYQDGKPEQAVRDLEAVAAERPDDAEILDRLGQSYAALDRAADAVRVLRRAADAAPGESKILLHLGRALADAGNAEESKAVLERFRQLGPEKKRQAPAGLVEYLGMTEEQRRADLRARVAKEVREHPDDSAARLAWLKLTIEDRAWDRLPETLRDLPEGAAADAGRMLLGARRMPEAIAVFERLPKVQRPPEYLLATGSVGEAMKVAPPRAEFYRLAAALAPEHALDILEQGMRVLPQNREVLLLDACALALAGRGGLDRLREVEQRWPEWYPLWVVKAIVTKDPAAWETASALGAPTDVRNLDLKAVLAGKLID